MTGYPLPAPAKLQPEWPRQVPALQRWRRSSLPHWPLAPRLRLPGPAVLPRLAPSPALPALPPPPASARAGPPPAGFLGPPQRRPGAAPAAAGRRPSRGKVGEFLMRGTQQGGGAKPKNQDRHGQDDRGEEETKARKHGREFQPSLYLEGY